MRVEIDHKVRNTLQVVASMLSLELRRAGPASAERAGLMRVQARLNCLSLVQRRSSAAVDAPAVMRLDLIAAEIADHLFAEPQPGAATFDTFGVLDPVFGSPDQASAFALFVNEALMGERDRRGGGSVSLALRSVEGGGFLLTVSAHDGATPVGGAADDEPLGARLMANCAAQLHATLTREHVGALREVRLAMHGRLSP